MVDKKTTEIKKQKLEDVKIDELKKIYEHEQTTNERGEIRVRVVLKDITEFIPEKLKGRRVYIHQDFEENKYYLLYSHKVGIDKKFVEEKKRKVKDAQDELKSEKNEIKQEIKDLRKEVIELAKSSEFDKAKKIADRIDELEGSLSRLPKRIKMSDV